MNNKNIWDGLATLFIPVVLYSLFLICTSRQVDSDVVRLKDSKFSMITKNFDGSLSGRLGKGINPCVGVVDKNADGVADYIRAGYFAGRNGAEFRYDVPEAQQKLYQEVYRKSKFSK